MRRLRWLSCSYVSDTRHLRFWQLEEHLDYLSLQVRVTPAAGSASSVAHRSSYASSHDPTPQALLFKQTELGFAGQIRVFFRHTRRLD